MQYIVPIETFIREKLSAQNSGTLLRLGQALVNTKCNFFKKFNFPKINKAFIIVIKNENATNLYNKD